MFGCANAPYQVEGGFNGHGEPLNNWVEFERSGRGEPSGEAIRFWTDYPQQLELAKGMGLNAFRMGIEWARVQPETSTTLMKEPAFDEGAIAAYSAMIAAIMKAGMEPIEAVIRSSAQRLRPVFLTTVTAIGGLFPMMYAVEIDFWKRTVEFGSANAGMWVQISTAIIFGLAFSKMITLGLVPAMLALPYRVRQRHGSFLAMFAAMPGGMGRALLWPWRRLRRLLGYGPQVDAAPAE